MASEYMAIYYDIDASRIPSQIIAGIGFIGAGTILRNGFNVRGVTTAAGILSVTCIGIAVGMGYYIAAIISTLIVYFILSVNHEVHGNSKNELLNLSISISGNTSKTIEDIQDFFKVEKINIQSIKKEEIVDSKQIIEIYRIAAYYDTNNNSKSDIISKIISKKNVIEVIDENNTVE